MYNYADLEPEEIEYVDIGPVDEIQNGERLFVEIGDFQIVIFNIAEQFFAIGDVCSHDGGPLGDGELEDQQIICPRHGARFDVRTGTVLTLPAFEDIPAYPVSVENGRIKVGVPVDESLG
jgi:3-phenylpropionate/trans-cinnamate dioxygenase ferredoxin component